MEKSPSLADEELRDKYDIVFIGGGPATLSFFSFICRNKNFENFFNTLNVLIIEKSETFGSGCLGKYGINSNTSAEGFVRLICFNDDENGKEEKQNLSPNKKKVNETTKNNFFNNKENSSNSNSNSKSNFNASATNFTNTTIFQKFKNKVVPVFEELLHSNETKNLINIGSKIAPLSMIGNFLDCVGNALSYYIYNKFHKKILMNHCEVLKINVDQDKCFETDNLKIRDLHNSKDYPFEIFIERKLKNFYNNHNSNNNNCRENNEIVKHYTLKSKLVVMASGGQQKFDDKLKQEILKQLSPSDFFHSDYILQENGFNHLINNLKLKEKKRVLIIGGSHSGFSCAWLLLNGFIDIQKLKEQNKSIRLSSAFSNNNNNTNENNYSHNQTGASYRCKINRNCSDCRNYHCCFGSVTDRSWNKSKSLNSNIPIAAGNYFNMDNLEIHILYRDHIRVYYHSEREALNDGYNVYDQSKAVNKNGNVYPFIGIRGDAKELYRKIIIGKEKRVKLIKCNTSNEQKDHFSKANVVIWACGYTSQKINLFDTKNKNKEIEFYTDTNNQFDVDKELHLLNKKKSPFINLFGIGQGFSTHSIEVLSNGKYARADSVNLYNTYISKKLFRVLDIIFNFTGENLNNVNNNTKADKEKEKEKENLKKTSHLNKNNQANNNNHNQNQQNHNPKKHINEGGNLNNNITSLKQQYANYNSNMTNNYHNENYGNNNNKNREAHKENNSSKKVIRLIQNENSNNFRSSNNFAPVNSTNNNNHKNNNLVSSSNLLNHSNSQNFYNSPNLKTVKLMNNNLTNINNTNAILDSKKLTTKNPVLVNSVYQSNVNNNANNNNNLNDYYYNKIPSIIHNNNHNADLNLPNNDLSKSEINVLESKKNKKISTNTILRANVSRSGVNKYGNSSKNNFYKNPLNNESQIEFSQILNNNNFNNNNNNLFQNGNLKGEFSPPSRSMNIRNSINDHISESNSINRNFPIKRESSMIKSLQQNQNNINISNKNNFNSNSNINSPNLPGNTKTNTINKNFSNLNNLVNNNMNINQASNNLTNTNNIVNNHHNNHSNFTSQNSLTPNIYTNKNIIISRDYVSKSPKTSNINTNFINSNQNHDAFKSTYRDFNIKEKNLMNSNQIRKGNINEIHRNQVYFGKTQSNGNLKNANNNLNNNNHHEQNFYNNSTEKYNDMNNKNIIGTHNKYPSFNSPIIEKPLLRYQISPITNANKGKSKYILYDSTKNFIGNINNVGISNSHNHNYHLNSSNFTNKMGKN